VWTGSSCVDSKVLQAEKTNQYPELSVNFSKDNCSSFLMVKFRVAGTGFPHFTTNGDIIGVQFGLYYC
jgi:hypothetical protein